MRTPPRRQVRDVVGDAALLVLADGKRAVVWPRQARGVLVARRTNIYQRAVEGRETRVADVREDDRVDVREARRRPCRRSRRFT